MVSTWYSKFKRIRLFLVQTWFPDIFMENESKYFFQIQSNLKQKLEPTVQRIKRNQSLASLIITKGPVNLLFSNIFHILQPTVEE